MLNGPLLSSPPGPTLASKSSLTGSEELGSAATRQAKRYPTHRRNGQAEPVRDLFTSSTFGLLLEKTDIMKPRSQGIGTSGSSQGPSSVCHLEV